MSARLSTDFPGGNGLLLDQYDKDGRVVVRFAAEPRNCPEAMWFHFRLDGLNGRAARAALANPEQTLGGGDWSGNRPVFRTGREWSRTAVAEPFYRPDGRTEWAWDLPGGADRVEFAHCYPYQAGDLDAVLADRPGAFLDSVIGVSLGGLPLRRLMAGRLDAGRPAVYLTARHHAGETPGSWVLDGLLRRVAAEAELRDRVAWLAVPFVNVDDVVSGSYGKNPHPHDCNRGYGRSARRPESLAVMADARRAKGLCSRLLFLDLHAPSHAEQVTYVPLRGWDAGSPVNPIGEEFAGRLNRAVPERLRSPRPFTMPPSGGDATVAGMPSTRWARAFLGVEAVVLETSYQGNGTVYYTIEDYRRIGEALAETAAAWVSGG